MPFFIIETSTKYSSTWQHHPASVAEQRNDVCLPTTKEPPPEPKPNLKTLRNKPKRPTDKRDPKQAEPEKKREEEGGATAASRGPAKQ